MDMERDPNDPSACLRLSLPNTTAHNGGDMSDKDPGVGEKLKGISKEATGKTVGDDDMKREGEAQQKKAQKADEAARHEEEAERKRAEQAGHKGDEVRHQD